MKFNDIPVRGIDVSEFNGVIDWSKVTGCDFTAIRVGHGRVTDKTFKANWTGAKGKTYRIPYWYMDYYSNHMDTSANGISDADWGKLQAEKYWELVKGDPEGIVFLDIESASVADYTVQESYNRVLVIARSFLARADELSGKMNGIYVSLSMTDWLDKEFRNRPLWVAWYNKLQTRESVLAAVKARGWTGKCLIWQYASDGDLDGDGTADGQRLGMQYKFLDLNMWLGSESEFAAWIGGQQVSIYPKLKHPLKSEFRVSQKFGMNPDWYTKSKGHNGIDWATPVGTPVHAMQGGVVIRSMDYSQPGQTDGKIGYGRHVRIQHAQGVSIYGHFSRRDVVEGQKVVAGQQLGLSGGDKSDPNSGFSTGPHLHAEYRMDGIKNPVPGGYEYNAIDILPLLEPYQAPGEIPPIPEPEPLPVDAKFAVTLVNLNVRKVPGGSIWATAPKGTKFEVLEIKGDWIRVGWQQWVIAKQNGVDYLRFE